jgi:hypothetical protein
VGKFVVGTTVWYAGGMSEYKKGKKSKYKRKALGRN